MPPTNYWLGGINIPDYELAGLTAVYSDGGGAGPFRLSITYTGAADFDTDRFVLTIADTIQDAAGNPLNGDWTDDVSLISGDANEGGDAIIHFNILEGDTDRSGRVFPNDTLGINATQFASPASPNYDPFKDLDGSGRILPNDTLAANARQFARLPMGTPQAPPAAPPAASVAGDAASSSAEDDDVWSAELVDEAIGQLF